MKRKMARRLNQLDRVKFCCSICLDLLGNPATIPCGHSYCIDCIKAHWNEEDHKGVYSCPQCRKTFTPRPILEKNVLLADILEDLKKIGFQTAPADHCYAGPEDVACDFCTGRKLKAIKSCLFCLTSYCEKHLQPHYDVAPLKKHKLMEPSKNLQENICGRHDEVMKIFCRTDQKCICYLCFVDDHKGHDAVSAAAERTERQKELEVSRQQIQQRIQDREKDVKLLQQEVETINRSADKTVEDSEKIFNELIRFIQRRSSDVKQQVRFRQETEASRVKELQEKLEQELTELKRKEAELKQLLHTEDDNQFLHNYPSLSPPSESTHPSSISIHPLSYFEDVTAAVSKLREKLLDVLTDKGTNFPLIVTDACVLQTQLEPTTRAEFLRHSCELTLDPNTAHTQVLLSKRNRKGALVVPHQPYPDHPDRFVGWWQVLSKETLPRCCYWEVELNGVISVAITAKNIGRSGNLCRFGRDDKCWSLYYFGNSYEFYHNSQGTSVSGPMSSRIGVYLDYEAGNLSFYSVSETMTLLHRVQTTFTQPLCAGFCFWVDDSTAEFCKMK